MPNEAHFKEKLTMRLNELTGRLHEIEAELDEPQSKDDEERATEREGDEVLEQLGNAGLREVEQIQAALKRMEEGTYGECVHCGEEISEARLEVLPHTPLCRICA